MLDLGMEAGYGGKRRENVASREKLESVSSSLSKQEALIYWQ